MPIEFQPTIAELLRSRADKPLTVLSGPNNQGKSLVLKNLRAAIGNTAHIVAVNRFYHVHELQSMPRDPNELLNYEHQFNQQFTNANTNFEQNTIELQRALSNLSDESRTRLFDLCGEILDAKVQMKRVEPNNDLSPRYIDIDGQNASLGSTGARLLLTTLAILMDERFPTVLVDEPELGLAPRVQRRLAGILEDPEQRAARFPNLERLVIATHSHLFLARRDPTDNFIVGKEGDKVTLTQVNDLATFHKLQFRLLGNSLEALFLPAAIVVVEGKTDHAYLDRVLALRFPDQKITLIAAHGDGAVKERIHELRSTLGELDKSPFGSRLFVVLDEVHQPGLVADLTGMRVPEQQIVTWDENGIEFVYPASALCDVFECGADRLAEMEIDGDTITIGEISRRKTELSDEVLRRLDANTQLPDELESKLLTPLTEAIS